MDVDLAEGWGLHRVEHPLLELLLLLLPGTDNEHVKSLARDWLGTVDLTFAAITAFLLQRRQLDFDTIALSLAEENGNPKPPFPP